MDNNQIDNIIIANLNGVSTEMEDKKLLEWIDSCCDNLKYYSEMKAVWYAARQVAPPAAEPVGSPGPSARNRAKNTIRRWSYAFAAIAFVSCLLFAGYKFFGRNRMVSVENDTLAAMKIEMPEGSTIWLGEGSSISYNPKTYNKKRHVNLVGAADLEITPNRLHPFVLTGPTISITVLGTVFSVRDFPGEFVSETTLAEGAIVMNVKRTNNSLNVGVGQKAIYNHMSGDVKIETVNTDRLSLLRFGIVSIESASLDEILSRLERNYGKTLLLRSLAIDSTARYTFNYPEDACLEDVIEMLEKISGSEIHIVQ